MALEKQCLLQNMYRDTGGLERLVGACGQTLGSMTMAKGRPVMTTARPARSEKSSPSLTLPRHTAKKMAPRDDGSFSFAL